jgi:hypothetical protein
MLVYTGAQPTHHLLHALSCHLLLRSVTFDSGRLLREELVGESIRYRNTIWFRYLPECQTLEGQSPRDSLGHERAATKVWLQNVFSLEKNVAHRINIHPDIRFDSGLRRDRCHEE